ncbi:hypothetical protein CO659_25550 [Rhizobium sp. S9]|uniref:hypothetical protein n=1 Tax=unclassified Rhizobium TaxID=2613769 RepID=UPI000A26A272|nr:MULTISPECIES: hypothetical protein [unclassified Rhizobium]PDS95096.1 hypothetical protein CO659_25550 [Rhizobium sp. S9]
MKHMKTLRAAQSPALSVEHRAEVVYRRIAEASRRLELRAIDVRRRATVLLYLRAVVACAAGHRIQSVKHTYRQLEFSALAGGVRGMLFSESTFRRHVKFQRGADAVGEGLTLEAIAAAEELWREEGSVGNYWPLQRLMNKARCRRRVAGEAFWAGTTGRR